MMRSVAIYGGLLVLLSGAAWVQWTAEPAPDLEGKVVLLQGDAEDIEKIIWKTDKEEAVLEQRRDERGPYVWVTHTRWEEKKKPEDPAAPPTPEGAEGEAAPPAPEPAAPAEKEAKVQVFKAGESGTTLLDALSPMLAIRKLEGVDDAKLETIGLKTPSGTMEIVRKGRTTKLDVGGEAFGTRDVYLRDQATGEIYLVDDEVLRPLKYARTRLPDRELFSFERPKIAEVTVEDALGGKLLINQINAADEQNAAWVRASAPGEQDEQLKTWMDKALKLKGSSYADPATPPQDLQLQYKITLKDEKGQTQTLEVLREGTEGEWWGRSEHTRGLVKLLRGPSKGLADDLPALLSGAGPSEDGAGDPE